jgi:hypothetical protein
MRGLRTKEKCWNFGVPIFCVRIQSGFGQLFVMVNVEAEGIRSHPEAVLTMKGISHVPLFCPPNQI